MLSDRYHFDDSCDFSHIIPELVAELHVVESALEDSVCHKYELDDDYRLGLSRILSRIGRDFEFINKKLLTLGCSKRPGGCRATISKNE